MRTTRTASEFTKVRQGLHVLWILLLLCRIAGAVEIGQTRQEIIARHGSPPLGDTPRGIAIYRWDVWRLEIQFVDETARKLIYTKTDPIADSDITSILYENGGKESWRQINPRLWFRTDGAMAALDGTNNRTLVLQGIHRFIRPTPAPASSPGPSPTSEVASAIIPAVAVKPSPTASVNTAPMPTPAVMPFGTPVQHTPAATPVPAAAHSINIRWSPVLVLLIAVAAGIRFCSLLGRPDSPRTPRSSWQSAAAPATTPYPQFAPQSQPAPQAPSSINSVTWDQFELVIAEVYRRQGHTVEISSGLGADGGVDVKLMRNGVTTLVQCKQWKSWKVSVKSIREFYGILVSEGAQKGIFISTGKYTKDCQEFADGKPIELLSGPDVAQLVKSVEDLGENLWNIRSWIDQFVAGAWILDPSCPYCRKPMALRHPKNGSPFWGCSAYPKCRGKREARLDVLTGKV